MDIVNHEEYHCRQVMGFFVRRKGKVLSPQFSIMSNFTEDVIVSIEHVDGEADVGGRLILVNRHFRSNAAKVIGFTSEKSEKLQYFYKGELVRGKTYFIPVDGYHPPGKPAYDPYEDYVTLFHYVEGSLQYTSRVEEALSFMFLMLDADSNGFVSASEMAVFKRFLGFGHKISEAEWADALFGWKDGEVDASLSEMSVEFFKKFIRRLCDGEFLFEGRTSDDHTFQVLNETPLKYEKRMRRTKFLESILECMGFDKDLRPTHVSRYAIRLYLRRGRVSNPSVVAREAVDTQETLRIMTGLFGNKIINIEGKFTLYVLQCDDWFSVTVKNNTIFSRKIIMDCSESTGVLPAKQGVDGFRWTGEVSECSVLALRLSADRLNDEDFHVRCFIVYERENGLMRRWNIFQDEGNNTANEMTEFIG